MSTYEELLADARSRKRAQAFNKDAAEVGLIERHDLRRIAQAMDRARANEGVPLEDHDALPDYPGQTTALRRGGKKIGEHGLVVRGGARHYLAHFLVPGRALPLVISRRSFWRAADDEREDALQFGPVVPVDVKAFARRFLVRCDAPAQVAALLTDDLASALMSARRGARRVVLAPGADAVHVDVLCRADDGREAIPAIELARVVFEAVERVAQTAGGFVATARSDAQSEARLPALLDDVRAATAILGGHVERVGDGAEARMTLDEPAGCGGALRVAFTGERALSLVFDGQIQPPFSSAVTMRPEKTALERARGLFDKKLGDPALDAAFLIDGNLEAARILASDADAAVALVGRGAALSLDGNGVHVRVADLPDEDDAVLDVVAACLALWRGAAHDRTGLDAAKASFS